MGKVVANVAENSPTEDGGCHIPVPVEDRMREVVEWCCEEDEEGWGHNESVTIHWEVMVNAMKKEVGGDSNAIVREVSRMEQLARC